MFKNYRWLILGVLACLIVAGGAYFWTSGLMDSIFAYRSPLRASPPPVAAAIGKPVTRRVVFVLIDALREDTSLRPDVMPFLNELRGRGAAATMHSQPPSYSEPGYTVLLTGAWPDLSDGPTINVDYAKIWTFTQDNLFSAAYRAGLQTAVSGYYWFERLIPQATVTRSFYTPGEDTAADRAVVDAALPWLKAGDAQLVLIHIDQVDYAGHHEGGPRDARWNAAARRADDLLREIVAPLDLSRDTLFVASDHGQIDQGGHGGQDPIVLVEPWVLVGAGVRPGRYGDVNMVDVAPTLATLLGATIPAASQGRVRTEMLALPPDQLAYISTALAVQQGALAQVYTTAIGRSAAVSPSADPVTTAQAVITAARADRLNAERLPRGLLVLVLLLLPAAMLYIRRGRTVAWLLGGAVLYVVLFNVRYAVLSGMTYSLSSVTSANDLVLYVAITAALAFLVTWLIVMTAGRGWRRGPRGGMALSLAAALTTIYLLAWPIGLSVALNGPFVSWTLPDFSSMFIAFLAGLQAMVIAALGVLFAVIALIGLSLKRGRS